MSRFVPATALMLCVAGVLTSAGTLAAQEFRAGAATSNITPALGGDIIGGFAPIGSTHIHDELHARCLVLDDGKTRLALVVCDLLGVHQLVSEEARKQIAAQTKIPKECVLISATHTHSATSALGQDRSAAQFMLDDYQQFVARRIADGVVRAVNNLRPAEIAFGTVDVPEHVFNRRWKMREGTVPVNPFGGIDQVKMNPPAGSPNLVEPAGPTDPTVSFFMIREPGGAPISLFATYSLHYVGGVGSGHISADYFGMFCEQMEKLLEAEHQSPPFIAMMANGTSGDINNINFRQPRGRQEPYQQMRYVAEDVASKVHATLADLKYQPHASLAAAYREPVLPWRKPTEEQLKWAQETVAKGQPAGTNLPYIYAQRVLKLAEYPETTIVPVQALRIGEVCVGTMPCEVLCEIGLEFKKRSPLQPAFMVSLNHGYFGYLPPPRQHDLGGYETWLGTNKLPRDASEKLLAELLKMAGELKKEE
jgi:neutral ceramidase